ncbi:MAG: type II secretion system F family protein [Actinomycetota bacterium]
MSSALLVSMLVVFAVVCLGRVVVLLERRSGVAQRAMIPTVVGIRAGRAPLGFRDRVAALRRWSVPIGASIGLIGGAAVAGLPGAAAGAGGGLALAVGLRRRREMAARAALEDQLADAVSTITASLRAGLSLTQSLAYAAHESPIPLGPTLRDVVRRCELGEPFGASLAEWSAKCGGRDARLLVGVLGMHRRSGGDLPSVLERLASTLRARRAAQQELRSLTAQARLSGTILGFLPLGFFGFLAVTARDDLAVTLAAPAGRAAIGLGFVLEAAAFVWIRRLLRVTA